MRFTLLSCSLNPGSRSRVLAREADRLLQDAGHETRFVDMREHALPAFDDHAVYGHPSYAFLHSVIQEADGVVLAGPVYNWALGSVAKNLIEATGSTDPSKGVESAWFDKLVTFLVSGSIPHSYMAYSGLVMSLMLDFKCVINPYLVYGTERDWNGERIVSEELRARLEKTVRVKVELAELLSRRTYRSGWEI